MMRGRESAGAGGRAIFAVSSRCCHSHRHACLASLRAGLDQLNYSPQAIWCEANRLQGAGEPDLSPPGVGSARSLNGHRHSGANDAILCAGRGAICWLHAVASMDVQHHNSVCAPARSQAGLECCCELLPSYHTSATRAVPHLFLLFADAVPPSRRRLSQALMSSEMGDH